MALWGGMISGTALLTLLLLIVLYKTNWNKEAAIVSDGIASVVSDGPKDVSVKNSFISKCKIPGLDYVVFVQGSGPHTIGYRYEDDKLSKEVVVSRKCAEAVLRGVH
ncbi:hypothetical protein OROGR_031695 [Orobanche gracilis]